MQKKYLISLGSMAALLVASVLAFDTPASAPKKEKVTCCKKTIKQCSGDIKKEVPETTTLENLSHQFISLPLSLH